MEIITAPIYMLLTVFQYALITRIVFDVTQQYSRWWKPQGFALMLAMGVYGVTDPPLRWLNRKIPPLNLGGISLDMGFLICFIGIVIVKAILRP